MSGKDTLYREGPLDRRRFRDGEILCWPQAARDQELPPLRVRLIRLRGRKRRHDVWLLTNVLDPRRLSAPQAGRYYRARWENEVCQADHRSSDRLYLGVVAA